ncbi:MAG: DUF6044 family protein [Methanolobus sp.]
MKTALQKATNFIKRMEKSISAYGAPDNILLIIAMCVLLAYISPYYILRENTPVLIHDNLDSFLAWHTILAQSDHILGSFDSTIPQIMNGLPRNCLGSEFSFILLLFYLFPPFTAYALNLTLMHIIAFSGMYLLLSRRIDTGDGNRFIIIGVSLCFALLPFWPFGGLTIAGMPLALYAFLNIREGKHSYKDWMIILLIPFYSSFALGFFFFLTGIGILWLIDFIKKKDSNILFLVAIALMTLIFLTVEYRLVYGMFLDSGYVSHRVDFYTISTPETKFIGSLDRAIINFNSGQYHAASLHTLWIGVSILLAESIVFTKKIRKYVSNPNLEKFFLITALIIIIALNTSYLHTLAGAMYVAWKLIIIIMLILVLTFVFDYRKTFFQFNEKSLDKEIPDCEKEHIFLIALIFLCFSISIFYGFWKWDMIYPIKEQITLLKTFNFSRYHFLHPLLWYLIFALALRIIAGTSKNRKYMAAVIIVLHVSFLFTLQGTGNLLTEGTDLYGTNYQLPENVILSETDEELTKGIALSGIGYYQVGGFGCLNSTQPTFNEFYSPELFSEIKHDTGENIDEYRVVSIGIHPAVAQYNGFYTLDSYQTNYPLKYKYQFRKLIDKELDKNEEIRYYFDGWGNRCYVFTARKKTNFFITKDKTTPIKTIEFNTSEFKNMGGKYIISAVELRNYQQNDLRLVNTFENDSSPWKIWLYETV